MLRLLGIIPCIILSAILLSAAASVPNDVLAQVGLKEAEAKERVVQSIGTGDVYTAPADKAFKALAPAARGALVSSALAWAKAYTESADFAARYAAVRDRAKPTAPESAAEKFKKLVDEQKQGIEKMKESLAGIPAESRKQIEAAVRQNEEMVNDPQKLAMMKQMCEQMAVSDQQNYQADLAKWNTSYPEDSRVLIAVRLRAFLEVSSQVDYTAELVKRGRVMVFAKPDLEARRGAWKLCYRAGKPTVDAARTFATTWLTQIGKEGRPTT
jgi:hypothetical protein